MDDVLVVGAGPVGLATALGVARAGRGVTVLEREAWTAEHSRAPAIWPRTREVLYELGVQERFERQGIVLDEVCVWDVEGQRPLVTLPFRELALETHWPQLLILPQSRTEALLAEALAGYPNAELRFGADVQGVERLVRGARVTFVDRDSGETRERHARFVAGCDGAHSRVRESIGAILAGRTYGVRAALADVRVEADGRYASPRLSTRGSPAIGIRIEPNLWRLILPFAHEDGLDLATRVDRALGAVFPAVCVSGPVWMSEFALHRRNATRYARGPVALAGDAAHLNSPVGGQGMNAGIQDAALLVRALEEALVRDEDGPLSRYGEARQRQTARGVNRFTDRLTKLLLAGRGGGLKPVMQAADLALRLPPVRRRVLRALAMLPAR